MTIDKEKVFEIVDNWVYEHYNNHIFTDDGKVDVDTINAIVNRQKSDGVKDCDVRKIEDADVVVDISEESEAFSFLLDEDELIMCVPKQLREKIQFEVEYILSGFDKVQSAVADITKEFQINRKGPIANAERELKYCEEYFSGDSRQITLLVFLDRSKFMNKVVSILNRIPSEANNYKEIADAFERIAAKLENLDITRFHEETERYRLIAVKISKAESEEEMNTLLIAAYKAFEIRIPWDGDFDSFMGNMTNHLVFE
jgi:hypothetical protein